MVDMPNGNPRWHETELPQIEAFFAPLADEIQRFAKSHNLKIDRYYHQWPDWSLRFTHPAGGDATTDIRRMSGKSFVLCQLWWIDDYDAATRSTRRGESPEYLVDEASLGDLLRHALAEMLTWQKGEWTEIATGYQNWHRFTRAQFESMHGCWPHVRQPPDPG